jgi:hypothetical protein
MSDAAFEGWLARLDANTPSGTLDLIDPADRARLRIAFEELDLRAPISMFLTCPKCNTRHIDEGDFATKPHHTHSCQGCGLSWRPAIGPTVGVAFLPGFKNEHEDPAQLLGRLVHAIDTSRLPRQEPDDVDEHLEKARRFLIETGLVVRPR